MAIRGEGGEENGDEAGYRSKEVQRLEESWKLVAVGVLSGKGSEVEVSLSAPTRQANTRGDASGIAAAPGPARFRERRGDPCVAGRGYVDCHRRRGVVGKTTQH